MYIRVLPDFTKITTFWVFLYSVTYTCSIYNFGTNSLKRFHRVSVTYCSYCWFYEVYQPMIADNHGIECVKLYLYSNYIHRIRQNVILHKATALNHGLNHFSIAKRSIIIVSVRLDFRDVDHQAADCVFHQAVNTTTSLRHNQSTIRYICSYTVHSLRRSVVCSMLVFEV